MKFRGQTAFSIAGVMTLLVILTTFGIGLANLSVTNLRFSGREIQNREARLLARSAVAKAIANVLSDEEYGAAGENSSAVVINQWQATGMVAFTESDADRLEIPYSTNNLQSTESILGHGGRSIPGRMLRLVGVGRVGSVEQKVDALVEIPKFPWAVATGGRFQTGSGVLVGSQEKGIWPPDLDSLSPADIVSNDTTDDSIILGENTRILGDVESAGGVRRLGTNVIVEGAISERADAVALPQLDPQRYDPVTLGMDHDDLVGINPNQQLELVGANRHEGNLYLSQGLALSSAHLFVRGDLTVDNAVQGQGVIVVDGNLTINGVAELEGATELAIVSSGRMVIRGSGSGRSRFRGIVYAAEGLQAERVTLVGSIVAPSSGAEVSLSEVAVVAEEQGPISLSKEYFIGTLEPGNPRYHYESVTEEEPASGSLIRLKFSRQPNSEYPIDVEFSYRGQSPYRWSIQSAAQMPDVQGEISWLLDDWTEEPRDAWVETILDRYPVSTLASGMTEGDGGELDIMRDISELIPAKDRIKVISWFE